MKYTTYILIALLAIIYLALILGQAWFMYELHNRTTQNDANIRYVADFINQRISAQPK